jgi:hypothetical protein
LIITANFSFFSVFVLTKQECSVKSKKVIIYMPSDVLAPLSVAEVAAFYRRLANFTDSRRGSLPTSLAATLMRQWLDNRDPTAVLALAMPDHLKTHSRVIEAQSYHRRVFLTEERTRAGSWGGIIPRWQDGRWQGTGPLTMQYESLVEFPLRYQLTGNDADKDLLYALHGFQLRSNVSVALVSSNGSMKRVNFTQFDARVVDRYDWDYSEHLTVPNPDYGSTARNAVTPRADRVVVYHINAQRIERAGLAAPYSIVSRPWAITDVNIAGLGTVNIARRL